MPTITVNSNVICKNNHPVGNQRPTNDTCCIMSTGTGIGQYGTITNWIQSGMEEKTAHTCSSCQEHLTRIHKFAFPLPFIALDVSHSPEIDAFHIPIDGIEIMYKLRGIAYYGASHFTARVIQDNGMVWYHDGLQTGTNLVYEGTLNNLLDNNLSACEGREVSVAIYAKCP